MLGANNAAGAWQADEFKAHSHRYGYVGSNGFSTAPDNTVFFYSGTAWDTTTVGGMETRPVNISQPVILYLGRPK